MIRSLVFQNDAKTRFDGSSIVYDYRDHFVKMLHGTTGVYCYYGQRKGRADHHLVPGRSLLLRRVSKKYPYTYVGLITDVRVAERPADGPARFILHVDESHRHNGVFPSQVLGRLTDDEMHHYPQAGVLAPGGYKRSAAVRLGFRPDFNVRCGIVSIK